ncbi:hypothetical protein KOR42_45700 [Thalassoglobus neptunius]|uniref:FlgN protein n=1 Tax=Thalassoglobus neptunius TaxID=1938619 RepID=A0A5C5VX96_9PLAN|nr:hypothetical protein [Thalassoglobus neptunius]TWT43040.1 hypothetical protein KOR42_45700 [Thalassoglobus neptunius]
MAYSNPINQRQLLVILQRLTNAARHGSQVIQECLRVGRVDSCQQLLEPTMELVKSLDPQLRQGLATVASSRQSLSGTMKQACVGYQQVLERFLSQIAEVEHELRKQRNQLLPEVDDCRNRARAAQAYRAQNS